jgi:hypothetical protein
MDINEAGFLMDILSIAYPSFYSRQSDKQKLAAIRLYAEMFADDDPREVASAVKSLIASRTSTFPPVIGEIKAKLGEIRQPDRMQTQEAWALASKAAAGNLPWEKLPTLVQKAIGSKSILREWGQIDSERFNTVIYSQFVKAYGTYDTRERERAALPSDIRNLIDGVAERMSLAGETQIKQLGGIK